MKIALYPGSFDPITNGHLDIIKRALKVFDKVVILVSYNEKKKYHFSNQEKVEMIKQVIKDNKLNNVEVDCYRGLTVTYCKEHNINVMIRGLRVVSDFEYEWSLAASNQFIDPDIEMVFFMAKKETTFISSSSINEMFNNGVDVSSLVPEAVYNKLLEKKQK